MRIRSFSCAVCGVLMTVAPSWSAEGPNLEDALKVIQRFEQKLQRIQFESLQVSGTRSATDADKLVAKYKDTDYKHTVVTDLQRGKIRFESRQTAPWLRDNELTELVSSIHKITYDGKQQREYYSELRGKDLPVEGVAGAEGTITATKDFDTPSRRINRVPDCKGPTGLDYFSPFLFGKKLSDLLKTAKQKGGVSVKEDEKGYWVFKMPNTVYPSPDSELRVIYDAKRGVVLGAEFESKMPDGQPNFVWQKVSASPIKLANNFWVPKQVDLIYFTMERKIGLVTRWDYKDIKINEPFDASIFRLEFPANTAVVDRTKN